MTTRGARSRLRVGVAKLASCDGCQLTILDLEEELLAIAERLDIVEFPEASSLRSAGPYDVLLVEGSVSSPDQAAEIVELRRQAKTLVTIGACATAGGIQALRNWSDHDAFRTAVYPRPELVESLDTATPISDHVKVDAQLVGCPISADHLRELLAALLVGRRPQIREEAVCLECKRRGYVCVMVATGTPCLGPLTQTGCGALCPAFGRGCYGCFGPREQPHAESLARTFAERTTGPADVARLFAGFTAWTPPFRSIVDQHGGPPGRTPGGPATKEGVGDARR
ncbi:MAG: oxidoreductase [Chloroflexi bacterium RBG_16_72_14]|nr:MAG: oxidoreductase [Chloroflexi bacterium RBG_16_72_14]